MISDKYEHEEMLDMKSKAALFLAIFACHL